MKKRYICYGGYVVSQHDKQTHYVEARRLPMLYKVPARECLFVDHHRDYSIRGLNMKEFIHLYPRESGQYVLLAEVR